MEILIGVLGFGLVVVVVLTLAWGGGEAKKPKAAVPKRDPVAELGEQLARKEEELQKALTASRCLEEEFAQAKGDADAVRKELAGLTAYVGQAQKEQEELAKVRQELKKTEEDLAVETEARQRLQRDFDGGQALLDERTKRIAELETGLADAKRKAYEELEAQKKRSEADLEDAKKGAGADGALKARVAQLEAEAARRGEELKQAETRAADLQRALEEQAAAGSGAGEPQLQ
ncbi:MAG: hypothetical protein ACM3L6_05820, partial [Deltaproteobacteria bacterium]